jgi:glycosyltransferase involved in cell wall biosynthesis
MNNPLISVITVVYNSVTTLEQTILSVINQTYKNIEYIIIDGGSTDGTVDIIKKYEKHLAYWVSEPDKGIYDAMNKGINKVTGEWINFMNSGDTFYTNDIIQRISEQKVFDCKQSIIYGNRILYKDEQLIRQEASIHSLKYYMDIYHQACFVSSFLHKQYLFDTNYKITGDYDFFYKMNNNKTPFVKVNIDICIFLYGGCSSNEDIQFRELSKVVRTNNSKVVVRLWYLAICYVNYWYYFFKKYFPKTFYCTRRIYRALINKH